MKIVDKTGLLKQSEYDAVVEIAENAATYQRVSGLNGVSQYFYHELNVAVDVSMKLDRSDPSGLTEEVLLVEPVKQVGQVKVLETGGPAANSEPQDDEDQVELQERPDPVKVGDLVDVLLCYRSGNTVTAKVIADLGETVKVVDTGTSYEIVAWVKEVDSWAYAPYRAVRR